MENPEFLKKRYDLHKAPEVEQAAKRKEKRTGEKVPQAPGERIQNYLNRFKEIIDRPDLKKRERGLTALKKVLYDKFVVKPKDIPESYFEHQQKIAREQGRGDIEITEELRNQATEVIITDQKSSLDVWVDYLVSPDATYPDWLKYYAFRSVLGLGEYDKEKKQFSKRSKGTTNPFTDLNREALAYVLDAIEKKYLNQGIDLSALEVKDREELEKLLQSENFGKLYAWAIEKVTPASKEALINTQGKWVKYNQDSDHLPLVNSLQGHGTGWCTAGESTAQTQLQGGDFYVYYSLDEKGQPTIPRAAIRMENDQIAEVRGIGGQQNLDPYIGNIVEAKLQEFPDGPEYEKKTQDMKFLTELEKRAQQGIPLTKEELYFLYEIDSRIEGFGYQKDPRIAELKQNRDQKQDYADIFGVAKEEVALGVKELNPNIKVVGGDLNLADSQVQELPAGLTQVVGDLILSRSQLKELPAGLTQIGGDLYLSRSQLKELPVGLTQVVGDLILSDSQVQELPAGLTRVGGSLHLENSQLKELPAGLTQIGGNLHLSRSQLKELPAGLTRVGGSLDLSGSQIKELPAGLTQIGGDLNLSGSQIEELPAGLIQIGGGLYLENSQVQELPAGLTRVGGNLHLRNSQVQELPAGLTRVGGSLNLSGSQIEELPAGLIQIGGYLNLENSKLKKLPQNIREIVKREIYR